MIQGWLVLSLSVIRKMQTLNRLITRKGGYKVRISSNTYLIDTDNMLDYIGEKAEEGEARSLYRNIKTELYVSNRKYNENQMKRGRTTKEDLEVELRAEIQTPRASRFGLVPRFWGRLMSGKGS
jgi:ATP-dependent protease Clp ATPase subunit